MKIKNIELEIGKQEIKLSIKQAKELRDILNETFPEDTTVVHEHNYPLSPYRAPYQYWGTPFWYHGTAGGTTLTTTDANYPSVTCGYAQADTLKLVAN